MSKDEKIEGKEMDVRESLPFWAKLLEMKDAAEESRKAQKPSKLEVV